MDLRSLILIICMLAGLTFVFWFLHMPDLGAALTGGGFIVAVVLFILQQQYTIEEEKRNLQLMLGIRKRFVGIDLRNKDLAGFYLAGKDFCGAKFDGANLREANLSGTTLDGASFVKADLRGAKLNATRLKPRKGLKTREDLKPGPKAIEVMPLLTDAKFGLNTPLFTKAKFNSLTEWPDGFDPSSHDAVLVNEEQNLKDRIVQVSMAVLGAAVLLIVVTAPYIQGE